MRKGSSVVRQGSSIQARVVRRGRIFRDCELLPSRLTGTCGYQGREDFVRLEDLMTNCTREWICDTVFGDHDAVCNNSSCAIGNWWNGEESWT
jgi:hypothetical protein